MSSTDDSGAPLWMRKVHRVYLTGPKPDDNTPAFEAATTRLKELGHEVYSPVLRNDDQTYEFFHGGLIKKVTSRHFNLRSAIATDLEWVARKADAIAVLPGWEASRGASAAVATARALELPVAPVEAFWPSGPDPRALL